jgi:hypothetical protein
LEKINNLNKLNKVLNEDEENNEEDSEEDVKSNVESNKELNGVEINKLVDNDELCKIDKELLLNIETFLVEKNVLNDEIKEEIMVCEMNLVRDESLNDYLL